jgi:hypothetical protein
MSWGYSQSTGVTINPTGTIIGTGYSGHPPHVNDGAAQDIPDVGPIPVGLWDIGEAFDAPDTGPMSIPLTPQGPVFNRSGFRIHGDEIAHAGEQLASHGCIILPLTCRLLISQSTDKVLEVTA